MGRSDAMIDGALIVRFVVSLAVVIGLMVLLAAALRKRGIVVGPPGSGGRRATQGVQVEVLARRALGRSAQVAVVRAAGRTLVLGVTDHQVTMLTETQIDEVDLEAMQAMTAEGQRTAFPGGPSGRSGPAWKMMLDGMRDRTVRR
jgi:flagellar biosynthetic protein FliO